MRAQSLPAAPGPSRGSLPCHQPVLIPGELALGSANACAAQGQLTELHAGYKQRSEPGRPPYLWYTGDMARSFSTIGGRMETT